MPAKGIALSNINTRLERRFAEVTGSMTAADASTMRLLEDKPACLSRMKAVGVAITLFHALDGFRASGLQSYAALQGKTDLFAQQPTASVVWKDPCPLRKREGRGRGQLRLLPTRLPPHRERDSGHHHACEGQ